MDFCGEGLAFVHRSSGRQAAVCLESRLWTGGLRFFQGITGYVCLGRGPAYSAGDDVQNLHTIWSSGLLCRLHIKWRAH